MPAEEVKTMHRNRSKSSSRLDEGLRNTEIKRETDVRNSLGPQESGSSSSSSSSDESFDSIRESDAYGRETPGLSEDME
jgi:hypothetical protein